MTNKKSTKRALLMSGLALLMCVSMLIGSTFAWFTDSVTSAGNIIKSGTLDVEMYWADGKTDPSNTTWTDASKGAIFNYDLWEPGYAEVRHVKIENVGTLALKYVVNIKANGEVSKLADVIDVYFVDPVTQVTDRSALVDTYKVGTLADVLAGTAGITHGDLIAGASDSITIALKMQESAGNEYQGLALGTDFSVQVLATQLTSEEDSFDNQYDKDAVTYVEYDSTKTAAENATALQATLDAANEGDIILVGAGNWYATKYKQFVINTDNITVVGENGAVLGFENENRNSILDVHGDNVVIRNIEFNKNKQEFNQCILAVGAENLTVDNCTFYGDNYQGGNTPTMGVYIFEYLDSASDEENDEVTKYTITNNSFLGAAVGSYKGGANTVPNDPGAAAAQVSKDMVIKNNTFVGANILIENWRSWSKEANRDHKFVPTITGNNFVSPNLCFANTPHSIYLRCYRQGDPDKILPAGYIDAFVANNTIATPANDTVVNYGGTNYVLSNDYGTFYRDNASYGIIAYCYGQSFATVVDSADDLADALAAGEDVVLSADVTVDSTITIPKNGTATLNLNGNDLSYAVANTGASAIITNNGELSIVGEGKISFVAANPDMQAIPSYATNTITNEGTLTIGEGVVVENGSSGGASYAVDNKGVFTLNGGTLIGERCALRIAKYNQDNVKFIMNSGLVKAQKPAWIQLPSNNPAVAPTISVEINGGTFETTNASSVDNDLLYTYSYGNSHANTSIVINGGNFLGGTVSIGSGYKGDVPALTINGGNFDYDVLQWLADGNSIVIYSAN